MTIDLTDEIMAPAEAVVIDHPILTDGDAIDLAWDAVKASLPLIEAAIHEQIAQDIEAKIRSEESREPTDVSTGRWDGLDTARRIVRGEQP